MTNSTFVGNSASGSASFGGGIGAISGPATVKGTLLADEASGGNCGGGVPVTDAGYNLSDDASCDFSATGSANNVTTLNLDPLGLQTNGGPTDTIALKSPSAAIDQIPLNDCTDQADPANPITTDQRGYGRPAPAPQLSLCDIGSYEFGAVPTPTPTPSPTPTATPIPGPVTITGLAAGSTISGLVMFACSNPYGPAYLYIDDVFVGYYTYSWNTTKFTNGSHYLLCNGYRNGSYIGNAAEHVTVNNGTPTPTPVPPTPTPSATPTPGPVSITSPASGSTVSGLATFTCANPGGTANLYVDWKFCWVLAPSSGIPRNSPTAPHYLSCNGYRNGSFQSGAQPRT